MSTTTTLFADQEVDLLVTREDSGFLDTDSPLSLYRRLYPGKTEDEVQEAVQDLYLRNLAPLVKDVHASPLEELIHESGLSKSDVDILCIVMLEGDAMFDRNAQKLYDDSIYENAHFIMDQPYQISSRELYKNMCITR